MSRGTLVPRVCLGLVLVLVGAFAVAPTRAARAQDNGLASITIYNAVCPPDYTAADYYHDCYWTPGGGSTFDLVGPGYAGGSATTAANGFTYFEGIDQDGAYLLTQPFPIDVAGYEVVCSAGGVPFPLTYVADGVQLDLTTSDDLRCDWFSVPVGPNTNGLASITIYTSVCPTDYVAGDYYTDCYWTSGSGYTFTLAGPDGAAEATSGAGGIAFFEGIVTAGLYTLTASAPIDLGGYEVVCSEGGELFPLTYAEGGVQLDLTLDDDLRCDWFNVPVGPRTNNLASLTVYTALCPTDYEGVAYFADCYPTPGAGVDYLLSGPAFDGAIAATSGEGGFVYYEGIDADGLYSLQVQLPADFADVVAGCSIDGVDFPFAYGDLAGEIELDLTAGDDLRCDVYLVPIELAEEPTDEPTEAPTEEPTEEPGEEPTEEPSDEPTEEQASLTVAAFTCPAGLEGEDATDDCAGSPLTDAPFTLTNLETDESMETTTGEDGTATFADLGDGTYLLTAEIEGELVELVVFCSAGGGTFPFDESEGSDGTIGLDLPPAADVRCDWYAVPPETEPESPPAPDPDAGFGAASAYCPDAEELALLDLINDFRAENGLPPLTLSGTLGAAAEYHSQEMASFGYLDHTLMDGTTYAENMTNFGYTFDTARGENIAAGNADAEATFQQWLDSEPHRENILSPDFTAIGIGRAGNPDSPFAWYWTTDFGGQADATVFC